MDLSAQAIRAVLHDVERGGWDCPTAAALLGDLRRCVVVPVVRRSGLRGPAADQAEASGWEAAWDALRRPSARTADNPGGMVWSAVRRAVRLEAASGRGGQSGGSTAPPGRRQAEVSLDQLMDAGWQPHGKGEPAPGSSGPVTSRLIAGLVSAGWDLAEATDAIEMMADHARPLGAGHAGTRWRWAALRIGIPQWRARRLATLLLGDATTPGVIELAADRGPDLLADPDVQAAVCSTTRRWSAGPAAWLASRQPVSIQRAGA